MFHHHQHHVMWVCGRVMFDTPFLIPLADNNITKSISEMIPCSSSCLSTDEYGDPLSGIRWFMHYAEREQKGIALLILPSFLNRTLNDESLTIKRQILYQVNILRTSINMFKHDFISFHLILYLSLFLREILRKTHKTFELRINKK